MSISVNNITKLYGTQKALDSVSFEIHPGEIVGLLGPNGAGKSTLMKIVTCFIPPTQGDASVCGFDIYEQSLEVRRRIGYLPENNPLYLDLYVKEYLKFILETRQSALAKDTKRKGTINIDQLIGKAIELTGLGAEQHKKLGALSRGYRQRAGIAQALIHDPDVLILDEPTSGLDPNQLVEIRGLIQTIGKEKTVLLSTHIMQEVEAICDRAIIINNGKIVADGPTNNMNQAAKPRTTILVEFNTAVQGTLLKSITGVKNATPAKGAPAKESTIWHLESDSDLDIRPEIFNFAVKHALTVLSMQKEEQKLEEVFQQLTKGK